ncbi:hydroxypyruvate reductase 2 [Novosphingobium sp. CF614]|uniref:2-hydroxyacid dehydrogenase n=1 Tax=Novosphingobium sp. CF614 TaxID=1884364 RepID=UPI0008EA74E0|nr:2-hydroxyacid dehydrogenase [Novosphingobium sp. CF614]SFF77738.1 hydroxypyruvate reductase 2 [Novosphingobium sp. CF614]
MKPEILMTARNARIEERLDRRFELHFLTDYAHRTECLAAIGDRISGIFYANSGGRIGESVFDRVPKLEIVSVISSGVDYVDLVAASDRGIVVTNAGGVNAIDVAEFALGLLIGAGRNISGGVYHARSGQWEERRMGLTRRISERPLGILGLGNIGMEVARRAEAFAMPVFYHNRRHRIDAPYIYVDNLPELARKVDFLIVTAPGGEETHHMVDRAVMDALGPEGVLVNLGRGTIVDTQALVSALSEGTLGAAALDVLEGEPVVPSALLALPNLMLTPHMASLTKDALRCGFDLAAANLEAHFAGERVLSPVTL